MKPLTAFPAFHPFRSALFALALLLLPPPATLETFAAPPREFAGWLQAIRSVGREGSGNVAAGEAWKKISELPPRHLPELLAGMDGANDYAVNWLQTAADAIAARSAREKRPLPVARLKRFLADTKHHPRARRVAYDLIVVADPQAARKLLPTFLNDPANELRRDAVQQLADQAAAALGASQTNKAAALLNTALPCAREADQIDAITKQLRALGQTVDLRKLFGWVTRWKMIGPFDNTAEAGFDKVFPPEQNPDLAAELDGKNGKVRWQDYQTTDEYGMVDFNQPFTRLKEVTGYAFTEFPSDTAREVELRLGCKNAWKVWLNGKLLFGRDEYHRGAEIDQYRLRGELKPGRNTILVKCCQNAQREDWTVEWQFQLRVTDLLGAAIPPAK